MELDPAACHRALLARDARFDGRFFTAVKTTGIYCRPVCPARPPRLENCRFLPSAAAAQEAGFRPCLRCRPESAPDLGAWRGASSTVSRALALIEAGGLDGDDVEGLAGRLGVGGRHLRRLFRQHLGASPVAVAQTRRVLLAKQLIHETGLPMTEVALASGFGSVRRFNETFQRLYDRPPAALRRRATQADAASGAGGTVTVSLAYRAPFDWEGLLAFFAARAVAGVEHVEGGVYRRTIALDGASGWVAVSHRPERQRLAATVRIATLASLPAVIARLRRMFDLAADPSAIGEALCADAALAPLVQARPGLRAPGAWDGFECAVRVVLGQQVSLVAARALAGRLAERFGEVAPEAPAGLDRLFPTAARLAQAELSGLGLTGARAATLSSLAKAVAADPTLVLPGRSLEEAVARLCTLPGVGPWTAHSIALRALREPDAFPAADVALQRAATVDGVRPSAAVLEARAQAWRPWRGYGAQHLWASLTPDPDDAPCR